MAIALGLVTLGGLLFVALGVLSLLEKLPPNAFAGIRTPYTRRSPENWYTTHRAAAPLMIFGGVGVMMAGLAFFPFSLTGHLSDGLSTAMVIVLAAVLLTTAILAWLLGTRASRMAAQ